MFSLQNSINVQANMIRSRNGHALPFGRLWYVKPDDAIDYAKFRSRSHDAVIRVYNEAGDVIETHEHAVP